jgi:hypothetical protein
MLGRLSTHKCLQRMSREEPKKDFSLVEKNGPLFRDPFLVRGGHHALLFIFACAAIVLALFLEQGMRLLNRCDGLRPILN